jgi:hypothetical protein
MIVYASTAFIFDKLANYGIYGLIRGRVGGLG